ncbi:hypothetical protein ASF60_13000 [Methylobacterium sp. Leaf113]|nr:hypothetical protein ASF60_13000 [Methylobacterium sp. Leaf113]
MLDLAKPLLMREDKEFDSDPLQLNVDNGTIDLRTGLLKAHDPFDFVTKIVPIKFDAGEKCPRFEEFLDQALGADVELITYVQKALGLTLTGVITEQVFFFPYGAGRTGKSTLVNLFRDLLGDYGLHTLTETLLAKQYDNGIPADLARMAGARMVTAIEANWNRPLDEARLKAMTGGEPITARYMRQNFFEFQPEFKLWFVANDLPGVRGTASAFWARVRVIPFNVIVSENERDPDLTAKLKLEYSGILAWAVRGCLAWQREGLGKPEAIVAANNVWMAKADHVPKFLGDELIQDHANFVAASDVYARYKRWCEKHGETILSDKGFKAALLRLNLRHSRKRTGSVWEGMKLRLDG